MSRTGSIKGLAIGSMVMATTLDALAGLPANAAVLLCASRSYDHLKEQAASFAIEVRGNHPPSAELESLVAELKGTGKALGYDPESEFVIVPGILKDAYRSRGLTVSLAALVLCKDLDDPEKACRNTNYHISGLDFDAATIEKILRDTLGIETAIPECVR
jgi:hypothetical protein